MRAGEVFVGPLSLELWRCDVVFFPNGAIVLVRFVWKLGEHHFFVCRHYRCVATGGSNDLDLVAQQMAVTIGRPIASLMAGGFAQVGTFAHTVFPLGWPGVGVGVDPAPPPPFSPNTLPPQCALLVRLLPLTPLPRQYARIYLPLMPEEANGPDTKVTGVFHAAALTTLAPLVANVVFPSPPGNHTCVPIVLHRNTFGFDAVRVIDVSTSWATQRRRGAANTPTPAPYRSLD